jgi:hypothetical protein
MRTLAWTAAGIIFALIGLLGVIIPIFPGIIFMIAAAFCFIQASRSRPALGRRRPRRGLRASVQRLEDRLDMAAAPALHGAERVQLQFWILCRRLLGLRLRAPRSPEHNAAPASRHGSRYRASATRP